ncbi:hypothetical protein ELH93_28515 (plasmid) [Rhizobium leguminosarum]|uniref:hypothetical protein n=1 Tax=Rhizobium leguminosarum TaxID=384 RepID=UPI0010D22051|nr:hypothetical protein [Rhizobium leguminosarum]TAY27673.1 hypothetical protein ELH93_28515 [Rhizobium leguminosarum]
MSPSTNLMLNPTDRVDLFGKVVCRPIHMTSKGYSLLVLEEPVFAVFLTHEEILDLLVAGELRVEAGYFAAHSAQSRTRPPRRRPQLVRSIVQNHPGNGTVH